MSEQDAEGHLRCGIGLLRSCWDLATARRRKKDFEEAADLPLQDDELIGSGTNAESKIP